MSQSSKALPDPKKLLKGKYLITAKGSDELAKRLKQLDDYLKTLDQDVNKTTLDSVSKALISPPVLGSAKRKDDKDTRLLAACCLASIIRLYAPTAPYDETQLQRVFELFIEQLEGLKKPTSRSFNRVFDLLERLVVVKAFALLTDEVLVVKLVNQFFDTITETHSAPVVSHMVEVMEILYEDGNAVTKSMLGALFRNLVAPAKKERPAAYRLAQNVIQRCATSLHLPITSYFTDIMFEARNEDEEEVVDAELAGKSHELIWELYKISPSVLTTILPQLEGELRVDNVEVRKPAVKLLGHMFAVKGSVLHHNYRPLFSTLMGRFNDIEVEIRREMVKIAELFLKNHEELAPDVNSHLFNRLRDTEEDVRVDAVTTVCNVAMALPDRITAKVLEEVGLRLRDRKVAVRLCAIGGLGDLYRRLLDDKPEELRKPDNHAKFSWIPSKILHCYFQPEEEVKLRVEEVLDTAIIDKLTGGPHARTRSLLNIASRLDDNARNAFVLLLRDKKAFQEAFRAYIDTASESAAESMSDVDQSDANKRLAALIAKFPVQFSDKLFRRLAALNDAKAMELLRKLAANENETLRDVVATRDELHKRFAAGGGKKTDNQREREALVPFVAMLSRKLALTLVTMETVPSALDLLGRWQRGEDTADLDEDELSGDRPSAAKVMRVLEDFSGLYPGCFARSFDALSGLLDEKSAGSDEVIIDKALKVLTNTATLLKADAPMVARQLRKRLLSLCERGTQRQAKSAVVAIATLYPEQADKLFDGVLRDLIGQFHKDDAPLETILQTLGKIALSAPKAFAEHKDEVLQFVVGDVLKLSENPAENSDTEYDLALRINALKVIARFLGSVSPDASSDAERLFGILFRVLEDNLSAPGDPSQSQQIGESQADSESPSQSQSQATSAGGIETEKERLRRAAATAILSVVARQPSYDTVPYGVTIERYQMVAWLAQDPSYHVRSALLERLFRGLREVTALPLRWMAPLALYATDPERDLVMRAKTHLATCVRIRRSVVSQARNAEAVSETAQALLLPEYVLPYLVHLLAHWRDFDADRPEFRTCLKYLMFYFDAILHEEDNFAFLIELLEYTKVARDTQVPPKTENVRLVADIALYIVRQKAKSKNWAEKRHPGNLYLPAIFSKSDDAARTAMSSALPSGFHLPDMESRSRILGLDESSAAPLKTTAKPKKKPGAKKHKSAKSKAGKKTGAASDEESESDHEDVAKAHKKSLSAAERRAMPSRKAKSSPLKGNLADLSSSDVEEEEEEEEEEPLKPKPKAQPKPSPSKSSDKKGGQQKKEEEEEEEKEEKERSEEEAEKTPSPKRKGKGKDKGKNKPKASKVKDDESKENKKPSPGRGTKRKREEPAESESEGNDEEEPAEHTKKKQKTEAGNGATKTKAKRPGCGRK